MRLLRWSLMVVLLAAAAAAAETAVTITPELKGAWLKPDKGWDGRTVLLLHGFASDMDDAGGLLKRLAHGLAAKGIASLRINFRGEGDAKRTDIESTFATRLEDTAAAYAWLVEQPGVNASRTGVMGFSLGASTAIETGAQYPDWFKSMAVWSSPAGDQFAMYQTDETAQKALRDGSATEDVPGWKKITTKREFYLSFRGIDLDKSLAKYPGAFLTVRGTKDELLLAYARTLEVSGGPDHPKVVTKSPPNPDDVFLATAPGDLKEKLTIEGADHIFNVFQPELGYARQAVDATVAWFGRTL
jgi:pimeloyl-ACP methyl ester carboxylesterase